jgi:hypothetical protein
VPVLGFERVASDRLRFDVQNEVVLRDDHRLLQMQMLRRQVRPEVQVLRQLRQQAQGFLIFWFGRGGKGRPHLGLRAPLSFSAKERWIAMSHRDLSKIAPGTARST